MIHEANRRILDQLDTPRAHRASHQNDYEHHTPVVLQSHRPKIEYSVGLTRLDFCQRAPLHYGSPIAFVDKFQGRRGSALSLYQYCDGSSKYKKK